MITTHNLGFPANTINRQQAQTSESVWRQQVGSDLISIGCDTVNDPMSFMMDLLGHQKESNNETSQWFSSDKHYLVPEFDENSNFTAKFDALIDQVTQAKKTDLNVKPVIIGPISYLWFGEAKDNVNKLELLQLNDDWKHALLQAYYDLQRVPVKKMVASYFGSLGDNLGLLRELSADGVHLDTINADDEALKVADLLPNYKVISVAVVDGSQHDETDFVDTLSWLETIHDIAGDRLWLAPSCSLAHLPKDSVNETEIENAKLKMSEVKALAMILEEITSKNNLKLVREKVAA